MFNEILKNTKLDSDLIELSKIMKAHVRDNKDLVVAVTGFRGIGKSLFSFVLANLCDPNFTFEKNVCFIPTEEKIKTMLNNTPPYETLVIDEAVKGMYKMDFMTSGVKFLYKKFTTDRKFNRIVFLNIPNLEALTAGFRKDIVNLWIHFFEVGWCHVYNRKHMPIGTDVWSEDEIKDIVSDKKCINPEYQRWKLKKLSNFMFEINFTKENYETLYVKSGIERIYERLSKEANMEMDKVDEETPEAKERFKMPFAIQCIHNKEVHKESYMSQSKRTGIPLTTLNRIVKSCESKPSNINNDDIIVPKNQPVANLPAPI